MMKTSQALLSSEFTRLIFKPKILILNQSIASMLVFKFKDRDSLFESDSIIAGSASYPNPFHLHRPYPHSFLAQFLKNYTFQSNF